MADSFLSKVLGFDQRMVSGMGASMQAAELGALAQVSALLLGDPRFTTGGLEPTTYERQAGLELRKLIAARVRTDILVVETEKGPTNG